MEGCVALKTRLLEKSYIDLKFPDRRSRKRGIDSLPPAVGRGGRRFPATYFFMTARTSRSSPSFGAAEIFSAAQSKL